MFRVIFFLVEAWEKVSFSAHMFCLFFTFYISRSTVYETSCLLLERVCACTMTFKMLTGILVLPAA